MLSVIAPTKCHLLHTCYALLSSVNEGDTYIEAALRNCKLETCLNLNLRDDVFPGHDCREIKDINLAVVAMYGPVILHLLVLASC